MVNQKKWKISQGAVSNLWVHSPLSRQILVFIVYRRHSPRHKLSTLFPKNL